MTTPTFTDGPPVPLMVEGHIDADTLRQIVADLTREAEILGVREKSGPVAYTTGAVPSLDGALTRLFAGTIRALQIHYRFAQHEWTDTIFALPSAFRVVRCRHEVM